MKPTPTERQSVRPGNTNTAKVQIQQRRPLKKKKIQQRTWGRGGKSPVRARASRINHPEYSSAQCYDRSDKDDFKDDNDDDDDINAKMMMRMTMAVMMRKRMRMKT